MGRTDIEDALNKLNSLIQKDVPMAIAQTMMGAHDIWPVTHFALNCCPRRCQRNKVSVMRTAWPLLLALKPGCREPDRAGRPKVVLSAGPIHKTQHGVWGLPQRTPHVVLRSRRIQRLDVKRFSLVGTWETYVHIVTQNPAASTDPCPFAKLAQARAFFGLSFPIRCHQLRTHVDH